MLSWMIEVDNKKGEVMSADFFTGTSEYIPALLKIARLVNEKLVGGVVRVLCPPANGVIGCREWEKDARWLVFTGEALDELADAARRVGLSYE